jgi:hypothetical protein
MLQAQHNSGSRRSEIQTKGAGPYRKDTNANSVTAEGSSLEAHIIRPPWSDMLFQQAMVTSEYPRFNDGTVLNIDWPAADFTQFGDPFPLLFPDNSAQLGLTDISGIDASSGTHIANVWPGHRTWT